MIGGTVGGTYWGVWDDKQNQKFMRIEPSNSTITSNTNGQYIRGADDGFIVGGSFFNSNGGNIFIPVLRKSSWVL